MKHLVKSTLHRIETLPSIAAVQTWAERIRIAAAEPVFFTCWLSPKDAVYAQLSFYGGKLATVTGDCELPEGFTPGGCIASGVVEGFVQGTNFIAARILDHDGNVTYPINDACAKLREAGFATLSYRSSQRRGPTEVLDFCLLYNASSSETGNKEAYSSSGVSITTTEAGLATSLDAGKNNPSSVVTFQFPVTTLVVVPDAPALVEVQELPKEEKIADPVGAGTTVGFYGKLPKPHKEYRAAAKAAGWVISDTPYYMVVFDPSTTPAKFRGLTNLPKLVSPDQFQKLLEDGQTT